MSDGKTDFFDTLSDYEKYREDVKNVHFKAMNEKDYVDLISCEKYIKQIMKKQHKIYKDIVNKKLEILKKYGWEDNWKHSDLERYY